MFLFSASACVFLLHLSSHAVAAPTAPGSANHTISLALQTYSTHLSPDPLRIHDVAEVKINGVIRRLDVDTGSADTWVFGKNLICADGKDHHVSASNCDIGKLYPQVIDPMPGVHLDITYAGSARVTGVYAYATVEIAGIVLPRQQIAFANHMDQRLPFYAVEGILGLAPGWDEAAIEGSYKHGAGGGLKKFYPTVFESMYQRSKQMRPVFSMALGRGNDSILTFGGTAPVKTQGETVRVPFSALSGQKEDRQRYPVQADGFDLDGVFLPTSFEYFVDSGAPSLLIPKHYADKIASACKPRAKQPQGSDSYLVPCNASMPRFGLQFSGKTFLIDPEDLLLQDSATDTCVLAIQGSLQGRINLLGRPFLRNLVADFDMGKKEMRFTRRG